MTRKAKSEAEGLGGNCWLLPTVSLIYTLFLPMESRHYLGVEPPDLDALQASMALAIVISCVVCILFSFGIAYRLCRARRFFRSAVAGILSVLAAVSASTRILESISLILRGLGMGPADFAESLRVPDNMKIAIPYHKRVVRGYGEKTECDLPLEIVGAFGYYAFRMSVNTHRDGDLFIRAYELTTGRKLTTGWRLEFRKDFLRSSLRRAIWSENENELFAHDGMMMINEGRVDKPYAARFELWFRADDGGDESLLWATNYVITGFHDYPEHDSKRKQAFDSLKREFLKEGKRERYYGCDKER